MAKSENQKKKLLFLRDYLAQNSDAEHPVKLADMQAYLESRDIHAERKSLYDDIRALEEYGMEIERLPGGGYYLTGRDFELPELLLLVDAVQSSRFLTERKSRQLIAKLSQLASVHEANCLRHHVVVSGRVKSMYESVYYTIDAIQAAIDQNCQIRFDYTEWTRDKMRRIRGERRTASPYYLIWDNENYYLIAHTAEHGVTHYRVDKMQKIDPIEQPRDGQEQMRQIDPARYAAHVFGMYHGEMTKVKMRFHNSLAGVVIDRFGVQVMLIPDGPEHFLLTTEIAVSPLFLSWIIGFGDRAKILWPERVASDCRDLCRQALAQYE